jgi:hypothetical protein
MRRIPDSELRHGTDRMYQNRKCRCDLCTKAHSDRMRKYYIQGRGCAENTMYEGARYLVRRLHVSDKYKGLECDLTVEFALGALKRGCTYCGRIEGVIMTLDRLDNTKGHLMENVVPACFRCNVLKMDMPHEAWLTVLRGVREADKLNLFNGWGDIPRQLRNKDRLKKLLGKAA